jgi:proline iminopeptidase
MRRRIVVSILFALTACAGGPPRLTPGEGYVEMPGGRVWYRVVGTGPGTALVLLHGGPGAPSFYLGPLAALGDDRPVVLYDQLGAGRSDHITDTTLMTVAHYVAELDSLRRALGLERFHLLGHSWGTMLGTEYALAHPDAVASLILASPALSTARWLADADTLLRTMPDSLQGIVARHEADGTFDAPEYQAAVMAFYHRYLSRRDPWTPETDTTFAQLGMAVYGYMWGPSEFTATGTLKDFDVTDSVGMIRAPTLFTTGEYDEARPATVRYYASLIPGAEVVIIPRAAHLTMQDSPEENVRVVREFLRRVDGGK